ILRRYEGPECVAGEIRLGTKLLAYTLERPIEHNIPLISSIPEGEYAAFIREDGGKWRLELRDVPARDKVQIHIGNVIPNTVGCILVGRRMPKPEACEIFDSKEALDVIDKELTDLRLRLPPDQSIVVTITSQRG